jgi:hypothetical protein
VAITVRSPTRISSGSAACSEAGCDVDGVACHERAALARPVDDDFACVDPDAQRQAVVELSESSLHRERRMEGALGVVLAGSRRAKCSHHSVAGEFLDRSAGRCDLGRHLVVEAIEESARPLRILLVGQCCGADEVCKHDRDELSLHNRIFASY